MFASIFRALLFLVAAPALACDSLPGKYLGLPGSDFERLSIRLLEQGALAEVSLLPESSSRERLLSLVLDGADHAGDGEYTGESYRAYCDRGALWLWAHFPGRADPLLYLFSRDGEEVQLVNSFGSYSRITGRFRAHLGNLPLYGHLPSLP